MMKRNLCSHTGRESDPQTPWLVTRYLICILWNHFLISSYLLYYYMHIYIVLLHFIAQFLYSYKQHCVWRFQLYILYSNTIHYLSVILYQIYHILGDITDWLILAYTGYGINFLFEWYQISNRKHKEQCLITN